jgi:hypothetical protein
VRNQHEIVIEWDAAQVDGAITPSEAAVDLSPGGFAQTIANGQIVGWILSGDLFFEDYDLPEYEGDDAQVDELTVSAVDASGCRLKIRAKITFELDPEVKTETEEQHTELFNAVSGGIQLFYWTGEGDSSHPEEAVGLYELSGEMNFCQVNGRVIHERRP